MGLFCDRCGVKSGEIEDNLVTSATIRLGSQPDWGPNDRDNTDDVDLCDLCQFAIAEAFDGNGIIDFWRKLGPRKPPETAGRYMVVLKNDGLDLDGVDSDEEPYRIEGAFWWQANQKWEVVTVSPYDEWPIVAWMNLPTFKET